jgi:hypothetical protein
MLGVSGSTNVANTVAIGEGALQNITTGTGNTALGYQTLATLTTGVNNTAIGHQSLGGNMITGNNNVAIGYWSQRFKSNTSNNVSVGSLTLFSNTAGSNNVAIGYEAGRESNAGDNVYIGYQAGKGIPTPAPSANSNIAIGYQAGLDLAAGNRNVFIGYLAGENITNGSYNILIGNTAGSQLTTESNKLYIENSNSSSPLIYGEFDNDLVRINGKLFISNSLDVTGSVSASTYYGDGSNLTGINTGSWNGIFTGSAQITGSLTVQSSEIDFTSLPTTDPGVAGRLFQTSSDAIGASAGFQVVCISQG